MLEGKQQEITVTEKKNKTKSRKCKPDKVYQVDVISKKTVSYYEIDLRLTAKEIQDKIDKQVRRNLTLLQHIIEEQVGGDFQKGEQQINDYINRFQTDFDKLLTQRVNRESESHEIVSTLNSQKSEVSEYLNELIFIQEVLDNWKPSLINR
jgi:hypothetical protein